MQNDETAIHLAAFNNNVDLIKNIAHHRVQIDVKNKVSVTKNTSCQQPYLVQDCISGTCSMSHTYIYTYIHTHTHTHTYIHTYIHTYVVQPLVPYLVLYVTLEPIHEIYHMK